MRVARRYLHLLDRPRSPGINNFSYVPALPSPTPSELGPDAVKQLMTMGTLMGTPRILSQSDDPADTSLPPPNTPFHIMHAYTQKTRVVEQQFLYLSRDIEC